MPEVPQAQGGTISLYLDVVVVADLSQVNSGAVLAAFGLQLAEARSKHLKTPSSSERLKVSQDTWHPSNLQAWVTNYVYVFRDTVWAYDCTGTWRPTALTPAGGTDFVRFATQRIHMGSGADGAGQQVQSATMQWYRGRGSLQP